MVWPPDRVPKAGCPARAAVMGRQAIGGQDRLQHCERRKRARSRSGAVAAPASVQWPGAGKPQLRTYSWPVCRAVSVVPVRSLRGRLPPANRIALAEVLGDLLEGQPADAVVAVDVLDQALEHQDHLRPAADVRMDGEGNTP